MKSKYFKGKRISEQLNRFNFDLVIFDHDFHEKQVRQEQKNNQKKKYSTTSDMCMQLLSGNFGEKKIRWMVIVLQNHLLRDNRSLRSAFLGDGNGSLEGFNDQ